MTKHATDSSDIARRFARAIVERRLDAPALLFLELHRPFSGLLHTSGLFAQPFLNAIFGIRRIEGLMQFLEQRNNIGLLIEAIEAERAAR